MNHGMITVINSVDFIRANALNHPQSAALFEEVAAQSTAWVCGRSLVGISGSNPEGGMNACLLCVLCVVRLRSMHRADRLSRGVLPSVARPASVIANPRQGEAMTPNRVEAPQEK